MTHAGKSRLMAAGLIAPLILFLGLFFVWPLASIFVKSVSDPAVAQAFPQLNMAMDDWDGGAPTPAMQNALVADLRAGTDQSVIGDAVRRLNSQKSGFRSLFARTQRAVVGNDTPVSLIEIDDKWADPDYWLVMKQAMPPVTDRFLLASVDLQRTDQGITALPPEQAIHMPTLLRTFWVSAVVTVLCVIIGLPYAMLTVAASPKWRMTLLACAFLPMWTSILVRCVAWFIILQNNGVLSETLSLLGLNAIAAPLLFTRTGIIVAMTHVMLPFMVLSIYSVLITIPKSLMPAATSLGARPIRAFWHVLLPLSLPGITSGSILVFMSALGFYILPALIGGAGDQFASFLVSFYAIQQANWPMAAAVGMSLLIATIVLNAIYQRLSTRTERA